MGTTSKIAIKHKDGSIDSIYCHWDGYLSHNGYILQNFYNTVEKVTKLIQLGDLSSLGHKGIYPEIITNEVERKEDIQELSKYIKSYARDFGETKHISHFESEDDWAKDLGEYAYLFDEADNTWYHFDDNKVTLKSAIENNKSYVPSEYQHWNYVTLPEDYDQFAALS